LVAEQKWLISVRTPLPRPPNMEDILVSWKRIPLPEPPLDIINEREDKVRLWVEEWVRGWSLWVRDEEKAMACERPDLIIVDMAPQPLMLFPKLRCPIWFLGHFNWFSFLSQLMEVTGAVDEVGSAYENAQTAFVPPFSWGQGIFPLVQEIPIVGGELDMEEAVRLRRSLMPGVVPVYLADTLEGMKKDLMDGLGFLEPIVWLRRWENMPAAQLAVFEGCYPSVVTAIRAGVPALVYSRNHELYRSIVEEMEGLGVAFNVSEEGFKVGPSEMAALFNRAPDAYSSLPSLYRLDGSQFLAEQVTRGT